MSETPRRLKDLRVADLKVELEKRGLTTSGIKAILADRLKADLTEKGLDPDEFDFNSSDRNEDEEASEDQDIQEASEDQDIQEASEDQEIKQDPEEAEQEEVDDSVDDPADTANEGDTGEDPTKSEGDENLEESDDKPQAEEKEHDEDSLNIMVGDEDNLFGEEEKTNGIPGSPPRPETAPVKHPFTSKDTISLSSRAEKAPSENSSMRVNPDESQSVASHDSHEGTKDAEVKISSESAAKEEEPKKIANPSSDSPRNLWISGLSSITKAAELKSVFSTVGKVSGAKIVTNSRSSGARCYGYVTMGCADDAAKCVEKLNKTELNGSMIIVELATAYNGPGKSDRKRSPERNQKSSSRDLAKRDDRRSGHHSSGSSSSHHRAHNGPSRHVDDHRLDARRVERRLEPPHRATSSQRHVAPRRDDRHNAQMLTFDQIKDQRKREQMRDEERKRREREKRRIEEDDRRRKDSLRRQREEEDKLRREREELKMEREKLEREKQEIMKFERERQRLERDKLEREKMELERLRRQQIGSRGEDRRGSKRPADDRDPFAGDRKRSTHRDDFAASNSRGTFN